MKNTAPSKNEINDVLDQCSDAENDGRSKFPGMSYEQGVQQAIRWMLGEDVNPMDD